MGCTVTSGMRKASHEGQFSFFDSSAKVAKKSKKSSLTEITEIRRVSTVNEIVVHSSNFVQENQHKFQDIYRVAQVLGAGSFGEVRICFHRENSCKRAVKIFRKDLMTSESLKASLDREISILRILDHPNIVRIFEFFEDSKRLYIVMEYCAGGELFGQIVKRQNFSEGQAAQIMYQLFSAVSYLHDNRVIHRDLKPENILLEERQEIINIKIIDFGTAIIKEEGRVNSGLQGTVYYIAPEVVEGNYDEKCDI